jgi:hypothetical protein
LKHFPVEKKKETYILQLLNDDNHSFFEVIKQLRYCSFSYQDADKIAWKTHAKGSCDIRVDSLEECDKFQKILMKIRLKCNIVPYEITALMKLEQKIDQIPLNFETKKDQNQYQVFVIYTDNMDIGELYYDLKSDIEGFSANDFHIFLRGISIRGSGKVFEGNKEECQLLATNLGEKEYEVAILLK